MVFQPRERSRGRKTEKPHACSLGCSLNTLWEWFWTFLWRDHCLVGFLKGRVWTEATPRGGDLGWNFQPNFSDSLKSEIRIPGAGGKALTQTFHTFWVYGCHTFWVYGCQGHHEKSTQTSQTLGVYECKKLGWGFQQNTSVLLADSYNESSF